MARPICAWTIATLLALPVVPGFAMSVFRDSDAFAPLSARVAQEPAAVWTDLQPLRDAYEGDPDFDLLLGRAALAAGHREQALLALERVDFVAPGTPGVRALLLQAQMTEASPSAGEAQPASVPVTKGPDRTPLEPLAELVKAERWNDAWSAAADLRAAWEGDPGFDYLFGVAALESGHPEEAVFALQRVLFFDPDQDRVRAQLARAHFVGGDLDQARKEFERVLASSPPPRVRAGIEGYLREIESLRDQRSPQLIASVEVGGGYDDNVNSATRDLTVATPFGSFPLGDGGRRQGSGFNSMNAAIVYQQPLSRRRSVDLMLGASLRHPFSASEFDLGAYRLEGGYALERDRQRLRASAGVTWVTLGGDSFQHSASLGASWTWSPAPWQLGADVQVATVRYSDDATRDVDQLLLTLSGEHVQPTDLLHLDLFAGTERARDGDFAHNGRDFAGASALWRHVAAPGQVPFLRLRVQGARYRDPHPVFAEVREDRSESATLGWNWFVSPELSARAELSYTDSRSSLDLFDYRRTLFETALRYRF